MYMEALIQGLSLQGTVSPVSQGAGTVGSPSVDMSKFKRAMFVLDVGVFGASATVDMKLQVSPDNSTWTDVANAIPATFTQFAITQLLAAGGNNRQARLEIRADQLSAMTTPAKAKFARVLVTVGVAATLIQIASYGGEAEQKPAGANYDAASVAQSLQLAGPT